jgi:hypothetical protein
MPALSILIIRTSLLYLLLGFTLGGLILVNKAIPFYPGIWRLLPVHIEMLLIGWIVQLVIGVAFWMLPRFNREPVRGKEWLVWGAFIGLNAGILLVCAESIWTEISIAGTIGRIFEFTAIVLFAIHAWPRIRPFGE